MKKKVILISAENLITGRAVNNEYFGAIICNILERNDVTVQREYNKSREDIKRIISDLNPDFIGISIFSTLDMSLLVDFLKELKDLGLKFKTIAYGTFITTWTEYLKVHQNKIFDFLIKGEPELLFNDIVCNYTDTKNDETIVYEQKELTNLDTIPFPKKYEKYEVNTMISRGCFNNCLFCEEKRYYNKYRHRSVDNIIVELEEFIDSCDKKDNLWVTFSDLDFLAIDSESPGWLNEFASKISEKNLKFNFVIQTRTNRVTRDNMQLLKSIGLKGIAFGIESGSSKIRQLFNKGQVNFEVFNLLKELKINYKINIIMFSPTTTMLDIKADLDFYKSIDFPNGTMVTHPPASCNGNKLKIYLNTDAYFKYKNMPGVNLELDVENYNITYNFSDKEVERFYEINDKWKNEIKDFLIEYYHALNYILYSNDKSYGFNIKVLKLGTEFKKLDLDVMSKLVDSKNPDKDIEYAKKGLDILYTKLKSATYSKNVSNSDIHYRGWYGTLNYILD